MDKKRFKLPPVGGSILLTVVGVLCLVTFSLLALSTARAGDRLSLRSYEAVEAYYRADCQAEELLARLRAGETPQGITLEGGVISYSCPIAQGRTLAVRVDAQTFSVLQWQAVTLEPWQADDTLPVWQGSTQLGG